MSDAREPTNAIHKVAFLFNHDASHQVLHTVTVMEAVARQESIAVSVFVSSDEQMNTINRILDDPAQLDINIHRVTIPWWLRGALKLLDNLVPVSRLCVLHLIRRELSCHDVLVVPETTSTVLRSFYRMDRPLLVWIPHGAGDRAIGFGKEIRWFDMVLVSGCKVRDRMVSTGVIDNSRCRIVGYPKFDAIQR